MSTRFALLFIVWLASWPAVGQELYNVIYQWNEFYNAPNDPNDPYYTVSPEWQVTIHHGVEGEVFQFEAAQWTGDPNDPNTWVYAGPGDINLIQADLDAGLVAVTVVADPNGPNAQHGQPYGAANVKQITLDQTGVIGVIESITIIGDLATDGPVLASDLTGVCTVGDVNDPQTGHVLHPIDLACFSGTLVCNELQDFTVGGDCPGLAGATLIVNGGYANTLTIGGSPADRPLTLLFIGLSDEHEINGTITISRGVTTLNLAKVTGQVHVTGSVDEIIPWGGTREAGLLQIDGNVGHGVIGGIAEHSTVRIGNVVGGGLPGWSVRVGTYDGIGMEGLFDIVGNAVDLHMYALTTASATIHVGGDIKILGFNADMEGQCHVEGDVTDQFVIGEVGDDPNFPPAHLIGTLQIDGNLGECSERPCELLMYRGDLVGSLSIGGNCEGSICIQDGEASGIVHIVGSLSGAIDVPDGNAPGQFIIEGGVTSSGSIHTAGDLGSLAINAPLAGVVDVGGNVPSVWLQGNLDPNGQLNVAGDLGYLQSIGNIEGQVSVGQSLQSAVLFGTLTGKVSVDPGWLGDFDLIGQLAAGGIEVAGNLHGALNVRQQFAPEAAILIHGQVDPNAALLFGGTCAGTVSIGTDLYGYMDVYGGNMTGTLSIGGAVHPRDTASLAVSSTTSGTITVGGDMDGLLDFQGAFAHSARLEVGSQADPHNVTGPIQIASDLRGQITIWGWLWNPLHDLSGGYIRILGSFGRSAQEAAITLGSLGDPNDPQPTEFVAIDYDALDPSGAEHWYAGSTITVGGVVYTGNTPDMHLWDITDNCKADLNNDGELTFDDIDPFVLALTDACAYSLAFPGLGGSAGTCAGGSRVFHGDCNCDGQLTFDDIDPFIARISGGVCDPNCPSGEDLMGAQQLATGMRAHVPAARHPALRSFVAQVIAHHQNRGDLQQRAYWAQVLARLSQ